MMTGPRAAARSRSEHWDRAAARRSPGALALWLTGCAASIFLAACSAYGINPVTPTRAMVTGTWVRNGGAVLVLSKNGTFTGRAMPYFFGDWSVGPTPRAGTGTWHVGRIESDAPVGIVLDFAPPSRSQDELLVERCCGLPLTVYYDRGDPDEGISGQYQLTRQQR